MGQIEISRHCYVKNGELDVVDFACVKSRRVGILHNLSDMRQKPSAGFGLCVDRVSVAYQWYPPNSSLRQTIGHTRRELVIQLYMSKRRMHIDTTKDQERVHMQFAMMEAIEVIKLKNAPTTSKTATRPRPSHSLNLPTLRSATSETVRATLLT
jgi:hypothetical protein